MMEKRAVRCEFNFKHETYRLSYITVQELYKYEHYASIEIIYGNHCT